MPTRMINALIDWDKGDDNLPANEVFRLMTPSAYTRAVYRGDINPTSQCDEKGLRIRIDLGSGFPCPLVLDWSSRMQPFGAPPIPSPEP